MTPQFVQKPSVPCVPKINKKYLPSSQKSSNNLLHYLIACYEKKNTEDIHSKQMF